MKGLKGIPTGTFADFAAVLERYRDRFWIPYSSTHLDDLARGYDPADERKVMLTNDDLLFISKLTQNRSFQDYQGQDTPEPDRRDPVEFFHSHYEMKQQSKELGDFLVAGAGGPLDALTDFRNLLFGLPTAPFPEEAQDTKLAEMFPGWQSEGTLGSIVQDITDLSSRANSDYTYSTDMRTFIRDGLPMLKPSVVSSPDVADAFDHIDKLLAPFMQGRSMITMMDDLLKNPFQPNKPPTLKQRFIQYYNLLDTFGYHSDSLSKKNYFPNILGDSIHAFLGGHCDFFITNDKDLRPKAKAVYRRLRTHTQVVSVEEFVKIVGNGLATYTPEAFFLYINKAIQEGKRVPESPEVELPSYTLPYALFDTFNVFELRTDNSITFFRAEVTYRHFTLAPVIQQVISFLDNCLGLNDNNRPKLEYPLEIEQMATDAWAGRQWTTPSSVATLLFKDSLELTIEFIVSNISSNS